MVVGAKANSATGRIEDLPGVNIEAGYKQKVVQWCFDAASPPIIVQVSDPIPAPAGNAKVRYVVYVAESDTAPHFLNGRKGIWVRNKNLAYLLLKAQRMAVTKTEFIVLQKAA
jgi:hypothetical protein